MAVVKGYPTRISEISSVDLRARQLPFSRAIGIRCYRAWKSLIFMVKRAMRANFLTTRGLQPPYHGTFPILTIICYFTGRFISEYVAKLCLLPDSRQLLSFLFLVFTSFYTAHKYAEAFCFHNLRETRAVSFDLDNIMLYD